MTEKSSINIESLNKCLNELCRKSGLGDSQNWTNRDYEQLSLLIFEETRIDLSISTLMRLFKGNLKSKPHKSTLDAIAKYAEYDSWFHFFSSADVAKFKPINSNIPKPKRRLLSPVLWIIIIISCITFGFFGLKSFKTGKIKNIEFEIVNPHIVGVPGSIEIQYDVKDYKSDSLWLKLYSNSIQLQILDPAQNQYNGIYLYPGYHSCQLYADNILVREHKVFVESDGWLSLIRQDGLQLIPVYINNPMINSNGLLQLTREMVNQIQIDPNKPLYTSFYFVKDLGDISGLDYILKGRIHAPQSDYGTDPCKYCTVHIIGREGKHIFSIGDFGCSPCFYLQFSDTLISGVYTDLSNFECDFSEWQFFSTNIRDNITHVSIGEKEVYRSKELIDIGNIIGIHFLFYGLGAIDQVSLTNFDGFIAIDEKFN